MSRLFLTGCLLLSSFPAYAHGEGAVFQLVFWLALVVGVVAGVIGTLTRTDLGTGLGLTLGTFFVVGIAYALYLEPSFAALLFVPVFIAFAGAIPLAIAYVVTAIASEWLRTRMHQNKRA